MLVTFEDNEVCDVYEKIMGGMFVVKNYDYIDFIRLTEFAIRIVLRCPDDESFDLLKDRVNNLPPSFLTQALDQAIAQYILFKNFIHLKSDQLLPRFSYLVQQIRDKGEILLGAALEKLDDLHVQNLAERLFIQAKKTNEIDRVVNLLIFIKSMHPELKLASFFEKIMRLEGKLSILINEPKTFFDDEDDNELVTMFPNVVAQSLNNHEKNIAEKLSNNKLIERGIIGEKLEVLAQNNPNFKVILEEFTSITNEIRESTLVYVGMWRPAAINSGDPLTHTPPLPSPYGSRRNTD